MRAARHVTLLVLVLLLIAPAGTPARAAAEGVTFGDPTATAKLGSPLEFATTFTAPVRALRVELLSHLPSDTVLTVQAAEVAEESAGTYRATVSEEGHQLPNTTYVYRFRVTLPDFSTAVGPEGTVTVIDDRFDWKILDGELVRLHWYEGDDSFAQRAVQIGDAAIKGAEELLGVKETAKVDFFIYAGQSEFRDALGPGTRENVGGQAVAAIRTLFGLIRPEQITSDWVDVLVTHELTHLVFNTAVDNPYHLPPRWLNEGLAVFRSEGNSIGSRAEVTAAIRDGSLLPLDAISGLFPTGPGFSLAYAESVSAVAYMVETYGQDALVKLIRSYAGGVTDDEAFTAAISRTTQVFGDEWLASLGATAPSPLGPQTAPPGPLPPGWTAASAPGGSSATLPR
jgi:hypothetical protein